MPQAFQCERHDRCRHARAATCDHRIVEVDAGAGEDRAQRGEILQAAAIAVKAGLTKQDFDDTVELGTRNIKIALKRLRRWVREGAEEELDLPGTIHATADHGYLDVKTRPERRNAVSEALQQVARTAWYWVDWVPARITAISFAVVGSFEEAIDGWRQQQLEAGQENHEERRALRDREGLEALREIAGEPRGDGSPSASASKATTLGTRGETSQPYGRSAGNANAAWTDYDPPVTHAGTAALPAMAQSSSADVRSLAEQVEAAPPDVMEGQHLVVLIQRAGRYLAGDDAAERAARPGVRVVRGHGASVGCDG